MLKVLVQLRQVLHDQVADNIRMLEQARQAILEDVSQLALLYELDEEPEGHGLLAMDQQLAHNEIHSLDIVDLLVVARKGSQNILQTLVPWAASLEVWVHRESSTEVSFDLRGRFRLRVEAFEAFEMVVALLELFHDGLLDEVALRLHITAVLRNFELSFDFGEDHVGGEPGDAVLARELELRISLAIALQLGLERLQYLLVFIGILFWILERSADVDASGIALRLREEPKA